MDICRLLEMDRNRSYVELRKFLEGKCVAEHNFHQDYLCNIQFWLPCSIFVPNRSLSLYPIWFIFQLICRNRIGSKCQFIYFFRRIARHKTCSVLMHRNILFFDEFRFVVFDFSICCRHVLVIGFIECLTKFFQLI